jgi:hypothetical protein
VCGTSLAAGGVYVVLAQDRDRFAREPAYHYLLRREFEEHGTKIRALNDRGDDSPEGELTDGILDQLAKYERAKIVERSRRGKLRKAREGKVIATYRPDLRLSHQRRQGRLRGGRGEDGGGAPRLSHGGGGRRRHLRRPRDPEAGRGTGAGRGQVLGHARGIALDPRRRLQAAHARGDLKPGAP